MRKHLRILTIGAAFGLAGFASAAGTPVDFYFAAVGDSSGTPISSMNVGGPGTNFDVSVWLKTPATFVSVDAFVTFDMASSNGAGATPIDNLLSLNGDANSAITNINPSLGNMGAQLGGGASATSGNRPYGDDIPLGAGLGQTMTAPNGVHLFDINMKNVNLTSSYIMEIYDAGTSDLQFTSYIGDAAGNFDRQGSSTDLTINAAPEPVSTSILGLSLVGLVARKRRR